MQGWSPLFFNKNNGDKFGTNNPKKDLMNLLITKSISAGHKLSFNEVKQDPEMVEPNEYAFYFGSFSQAAEAAWHAAEAEMERRPNDMGGKRHTKESVKAILVEFYKAKGRLPRQTEIDPDGDYLPSWNTMVKFLGPKRGWMDEVSDELGIQPAEHSMEDTTESLEEVQDVATTQDVADEDDITTMQDIAEENDIAIMQNVAGENDATEVHDDADPQDVIEPQVLVELHDTTEAQENVQVIQDDDSSDIKAEIPPSGQTDPISIELKITLPGRANPLLLSITV